MTTDLGPLAATVDQMTESVTKQFQTCPSVRLAKAMNYSLLQSGAKRFRPALALLTARALSTRPQQDADSAVTAFAVALECVHTYSLIHDDLPAMDDDTERRGQPTNHIQFDEATAILAGDALLTDAFAFIATAYSAEPQIGLGLIRVLTEAAGSRGMVAGQMLDIQFDVSGAAQPSSLDQITLVHQLKTGALIRAAVEGAAVAVSASPVQTLSARNFGATLGLAFQVADDILDFDPANPEPVNSARILGLNGTRDWLKSLTEQGLSELKDWGTKAEPLRNLVRFNAERTK